MRVRRLAAGRAVEDALAGEPVEALDREAPPGDAAREDDRPRAAGRRRRRGGRGASSASIRVIDARDEDLGAEPARLLQRAARELVPGHAGREAEVVLDPRRRPGLPAGRLALDHDRPQALRRAVDGRGQPGRTGADDHGVVLGRLRLGGEPEQLRDPAQLRPHDGLAVDDADRRVVVRRPAARPTTARRRRRRRAAAI